MREQDTYPIGALWNYTVAASQIVEKLENDKRIINGAAVVEQQCRDFTERVLRPDLVGRVVCVSEANANLILRCRSELFARKVTLRRCEGSSCDCSFVTGIN